MIRAPKTLQIDEDERFLARVAWFYHVEGLTQGAVAERLGVTRLRVNKALADARRLGVVRISINSSFGSCAEVEARLKTRFGLEDAYIVPSPADPNNVQTIVGTALGHHLTRLLANPQIKLFGMSWGNTLNLATRFMEPVHRPDLEIVSMMGGMTKGSDINTFEVTTRLADLCSAQHSYFTAPLYTGSKESRDTLMGLDVFRAVLDKIRRVDAVTMAAGDTSAASILVNDGLPGDIAIEELIEAGAVGDILGQFLDARGQLVDHPINDRVIGVGMKDLFDMKSVILAAGGAHKVPILAAALGSGAVDVFISDEDTAEAVLLGAEAKPQDQART
ncbi:sugar-binding transcriptional regulator [Pelagibius litoralis]|uniref:Sugar-binding transcriptional regulator n=1 Tax=Pelagibius litoralis TaxID=374515 RepID=A0A967EZ97_9PROT|nr:sugar-binding transcriptional regulator [Pelagibius litoralis]NIA70181.1 sugar-binding transcriptional regulator [Pelagibius litoralis]